ncbi:MAG: recombinase family protein [Gammaproteobacteria bacterium]
MQHNVESQRPQYGLVERARALGWLEVQVIDEDLGRSGAGIHRPGFERLLAVLCQGHVGAVFCIEALRLARNGRDWHTLLEFCRLVNALQASQNRSRAAHRWRSDTRRSSCRPQAAPHGRQFKAVGGLRFRSQPP